MTMYKLYWEETQLWESEVEATSQKDAISKVFNDEVQEKAEVERTYDAKNIKARKVK